MRAKVDITMRVTENPLCKREISLPTPVGKMVWYIKKSDKLVITPVTAQEIPVKMGANLNSCLVDSINGPPKKIKQKDGKKINQLTMQAPKAPDKIGDSTNTVFRKAAI